MTPPKTVLAAAHALRIHLGTLLDADTAPKVEAQLTDLLNQAATGQTVDTELTELLRQHAPTREWVQRYRQGEKPDHITRSMQSPSGDPSPVPSSLSFKCPHCDYTDTLPQLGMTPDPCPDHPDAELMPI